MIFRTVIFGLTLAITLILYRGNQVLSSWERAYEAKVEEAAVCEETLKSVKRNYQSVSAQLRCFPRELIKDNCYYPEGVPP